MGCLFCNVVARTVPAQIVLENDHVLAFRDIRPVAPTHVLVIPKKHITGVHDAQAGDVDLLGQIVLAARDVAEQLGLGTRRLPAGVQPGVRRAGQSVFHIHCHVLGGRPMAWPPG